MENYFLDLSRTFTVWYMIQVLLLQEIFSQYIWYTENHIKHIQDSYNMLEKYNYQIYLSKRLFVVMDTKVLSNNYISSVF